METALDSPPTDISKIWKENVWDAWWHKLIKKDRESLDLVIEVVEGLVKSTEENGFFTCSSEWFEGEGVKKGDIAHHFADYLSKRTQEKVFENREFRTRYTLSLGRDILRYLKREREGKINLLPADKRECGEQFLYFMNSPPQNSHPF